jgi:hypothetical protein
MKPALLISAAALLATLAQGCSEQVRPDETPGKPVRISTLAILNLPTGDLTPTVQEDILTTLASQIFKRYRVRVVAGRSVGRGIWGELDQVAQRACRRLDDQIAQAQQATRQLRIGKSIELIEGAIRLLPFCGAEHEKPQALADLYVTLGCGLLSRDREDEALAAFRTAVSFDPERSTAVTGLTDRQQKAFDKAQRQLLSGNPTRVQILSEPPGAQVAIDGRPVGTTPLQATPLYPGIHFVRLELDGHSRWTMTLPDGVPPERIHAWLVPTWQGDPPRDLLERAQEERQPSDRGIEELKRIAALFTVDAVLLARLTRSDGQIRLATQLHIAESGAIGSWIPAELGPQPTGLEQKLNAVAGTYPEFKRPSTGKKKDEKKRKRKAK